MINKLNQDIKEAMLAKNANRLTALRSLKSALVKVLTDNPEITELSDDEAIKVVHKQIKQRKESRDIYLSQGRIDLADVEGNEIKVLTEYLPEQLSIDEVRVILQNIMVEVGATSVKDTGKVMGVATKQLKGKIDNKTIGEILKILFV